MIPGKRVSKKWLSQVVKECDERIRERVGWDAWLTVYGKELEYNAAHGICDEVWEKVHRLNQ